MVMATAADHRGRVSFPWLSRVGQLKPTSEVEKGQEERGKRKKRPVWEARVSVSPALCVPKTGFSEAPQESLS